MTQNIPGTRRRRRAHLELILNSIKNALTITPPGFPGASSMSAALETPEDINLGGFNRIQVTVNGRDDYMVSVFVPHADPVEPPAPETVHKEFQVDHRSNPKLHALHVGWARETIRETKRVCKSLWDQGRLQPSSIASAAWDEMVRTIKTDAAWFEAAALEFCNPDEIFVVDPTIHTGESLRNLPPGDYTGTIQERGGKLYFELEDHDD